MKLNHKFSISKIQEALNKSTVSYKTQDIYEVSAHNEVYKSIEKVFNVEKILDFDYVNLSTIKKYKRMIKTLQK